MTETVRKTLRGLLELRDLDRELERLRRRCRECPALIEKHRRDYESDGAAVERKNEAITECKKSIHEMEVDLKSREGEIERLSKQLLEAKTNQEYAAFQDQIGRLSDEKSGFETKILESWERLDALKKELGEAEKEYGVREKEFNELKSSLESDLASYKQEAEELDKKRGEMAFDLDLEAVKTYERVLNAHGGDAIVPIDNRICSGCYMAITNNDYVRVYSMKEIVLCKSCQRILYIPEVLEAEAE